MHIIVLVSCLFLCIESATAIQCLSCAPMPSTVPCVTTSACRTLQECYAKYVLKPHGTVLYEFGCHDSQTCPSRIGTNNLIGRRATVDTELCYKCCQGDMCNQGTLCTGPLPSATPNVVPTAVTTTQTPTNPCSPSPCVRGSCFIGSGNTPTYLCVCPGGFTGLHCETEINPCFPSPCVRGSCFINNGNNPSFFCQCPTGFTGLHCESDTPTPTNPCSSSPCVRGSCLMGSGNNPTFLCVCPSGFTGLHCETEINPCSPSPCVHGSCFVSHGNNPPFSCQCPAGFSGLHCESGCDDGWISYKGHCYYFSHDGESWIGAEGVCIHFGSYLAEIDDHAEDMFLQNWVNRFAPKWFWVGGTDLANEGDWMWANSKKHFSNAYTRWSTGEPGNLDGSENCLRLLNNIGWHDDACWKPWNYICEKNG